jgi:TetR/AcrR family transcriptional regulator, ethionamide resistance regulator
MTPRARQRRRPRALRRASLCQAGWRLLRDGGPAAVTIEAVVAAAGVSRPIFYRHFHDRDHFLAALFEDYAQDMTRRTEAVLARGGDPESLMRGALSEYLDCVAERGAWVRALADHAAASPDLERVRSRLRRRQLELLTGALESSGIDAPPATIRLYVRLLNALVVEAATLWLRGEASREAVESAVQAIARGTFAAVRESATTGRPARVGSRHGRDVLPRARRRE